MADSPTSTTPAPDRSSPPAESITLEQRKQRLSELVAERVDQGYTIESQNDTEAVLAMQGRSRWFGLRGRAPSARLSISIDEHGRVSRRKGTA